MKTYTNMKKNILGLLLFCCMGLFVSCSDDDNTSGGDAEQIRVSAVLPENITTGQPAIAGHKMRCILELWTKGEGAKLAYHTEVTIEPTAETKKLPFDLTVDAGTYDCLMWVDYIDANTTAVTRSQDGITRYADKYYDTSNLRSITVKDMNNLINNEACDAYYYSGEVKKREGEAFILEPKMVRPFAKISILEKNLREFNLLKGLSATYSAAAKFDSGTGKVSGDMVTVNFSNPEFTPENSSDGTLFFAYVFANDEKQTMGEIQLSFTTKQGVQQVKVPADLIPLLRNQHIKVSGNMMEESPGEDTEFDIIFDIDVADWTTGQVEITPKPSLAKVGDFFYKNGTYSSSYIKNESNPCIGVVFAVAHEGGKAARDKAENYMASDGTQILQEVRGWVIALKDITAGNVTIAPAKVKALDINTLPAANLGDGKEDFLGFKNTEAFKHSSLTLADYPIAEATVSYQENPVTKAPANTSGWYWGAVKQYLILTEEYAKISITDGVVSGSELLLVGQSFKVLIDAGVAEPLGLRDQFYWSSTTERTRVVDQGKLYRVGLSISGKNYGQTAAWDTSDRRHARAILTF